MLAAVSSKSKVTFRFAVPLRHQFYPNCYKSFYFSSLHKTKGYRIPNCVKSIPVGVLWILPLFHFATAPVWNCRLLSSASSQSLDETVELLNIILLELEKSSVSCDKICAGYIEKLCSAGNLAAAFRLLQSLLGKNIFPGIPAFNVLLQATAEQDNTEILCQSFKSLLLASESISSTTYLILVKSFIKKNDDALFLRFLREISELSYPKSVLVVNRIIFAFGECKEVDRALLTFDQMKIINCKPDLITYNTVMGILGRCGRIDDLLCKFSAMKDGSVSPDTISYNILVNSFRKLGRLELCTQLYHEMGVRGVPLDLQTYTPLIDSFGRSGNIEEALRLFDEMKSRKICPSVYIYQLLISNLKRMGRLKLAADFSKEMNEILPDLIGPKDFKRKKG